VQAECEGGHLLIHTKPSIFLSPRFCLWISLRSLRNLGRRYLLILFYSFLFAL